MGVPLMEHVLENDTIYLTEMTDDYLMDIHAYASKEEVCKYQPWGPNTMEATKTYLKEALADSGQEKRKRYVFAVIEKTSNQMIGAGELFHLDLVNMTGEIGYIINPHFWGKGIATKVAESLIELGFNKLKLNRIYATCDVRNIASEMVLKKVGMQREGLLRENILLKDGWRDSLLYSILSREWEINE